MRGKGKGWGTLPSSLGAVTQTDFLQPWQSHWRRNQPARMSKLSGKTPRCCETPQVNWMSVLVWNYTSGQGKGVGSTGCQWWGWHRLVALEQENVLFGVPATSTTACTRPPLHPNSATHFSKWGPAVARSILPIKGWASWGLPNTRTVIDFWMQEKLWRKKQQTWSWAPTYSHCHLGAGHRTSSLPTA